MLTIKVRLLRQTYRTIYMFLSERQAHLLTDTLRHFIWTLLPFGWFELWVSPAPFQHRHIHRDPPTQKSPFSIRISTRWLSTSASLTDRLTLWAFKCLKNPLIFGLAFKQLPIDALPHLESHFSVPESVNMLLARQKVKLKLLLRT